MDAADETDEAVEDVRTFPNVVQTRAVDKCGRFRTEEIPGSGAGRAGTVVLTPVEAKQLRRRLDGGATVGVKDGLIHLATIVDAER